MSAFSPSETFTDVGSREVMANVLDDKLLGGLRLLYSFTFFAKAPQNPQLRLFRFYRRVLGPVT